MTELYDKIVPPRYGPGRAYRQVFGPEEKESPKPQPAPPPSSPSGGGSGSGGSSGSGGGSAPAPHPGPGGRTPRTPRKPRQSQAGRSGGTTYSSSSGGSVTYRSGSYAGGSSSSGSSSIRSSGSSTRSESSSGPGPRPAPTPPPAVRDKAFVENVLSGNPFAGLPFSGYAGPDKDPSSDIAPISPTVKRFFDDMIKGAPKPTMKLPAVNPGGATTVTDFMGHKVRVDTEIVPRLDYVERELKAKGLDKQFPITQVGGYANRSVRGRPGVPSAHSFGVAIDINWQDYPLGSSKRQPQPVVDVFKAAGFRYGGDFRGRKDPHHYSLLKREGGTPGSLRAPLTYTPPKRQRSTAEQLLRGML